MIDVSDEPQKMNDFNHSFGSGKAPKMIQTRPDWMEVTGRNLSPTPMAMVMG